MLYFFSRLLGKMPNTYAFTKAVAEHVVKDYTKDLPVAIFRPAIGNENKTTVN
jgi:nucleoside-diphosphate-sugar epimerase